MRTEHKSDVRDGILQAARRVVQKSGVSRLTLETVAAEAYMSKGGLLYHFPSKDALLRGLISSIHERFKVRVMEEFDTDPMTDRSGRLHRAWIRGFRREITCDENGVAGMDATDASVMVALATDPTMMDFLRCQWKSWIWLSSQDGLEMQTCLLLRFVMDGFKSNLIMGWKMPPGEDLGRLFDWMLTQATPDVGTINYDSVLRSFEEQCACDSLIESDKEGTTR
jgi:AcrR family transcriptional regulator